MRRHIGVDGQSKLIHSVTTNSASVHGGQTLPNLLHRNETRVWGDLAYTGQSEAIRKAAPYAKDFTNQKGHRHHPLTADQRAKNRIKS